MGTVKNCKVEHNEALAMAYFQIQSTPCMGYIKRATLLQTGFTKISTGTLRRPQRAVITSTGAWRVCDNTSRTSGQTSRSSYVRRGGTELQSNWMRRSGDHQHGGGDPFRQGGQFSVPLNNLNADSLISYPAWDDLRTHPKWSDATYGGTADHNADGVKSVVGGRNAHQFSGNRFSISHQSPSQKGWKYINSYRSSRVVVGMWCNSLKRIRFESNKWKTWRSPWEKNRTARNSWAHKGFLEALHEWKGRGKWPMGDLLLATHVIGEHSLLIHCPHSIRPDWDYRRLCYCVFMNTFIGERLYRRNFVENVILSQAARYALPFRPLVVKSITKAILLLFLPQSFQTILTRSRLRMKYLVDSIMLLCTADICAAKECVGKLFAINIHDHGPIK